MIFIFLISMAHANISKTKEIFHLNPPRIKRPRTDALKRPHLEKIFKYVDFATALENIEQTLRQHFSEKFGSMPFDLDG